MKRGLWLLLVLMTVQSVFARAVDPRSQKQFYIDAYGLIDAAQMIDAKRVEHVFERMLNVVDRAKPKNPQLIMVDSNDWPWAIALPDNSIIITKGAIELCYENVTPEQGDARVAMLLGHELTHLSENDYWHRDVYLSFKENKQGLDQEVFKFIGQRAGMINPSTKEWQNIVRDREIKADDMGFIYASLAGFDAAEIMDINGESFFQQWKHKTGAQDDDYHLSADSRTSYIKARFENLSSLTELFYVGLAFIHLNYLDEAKALFDQMLIQFPAHEIYNNLGYIHLLKSDVLSHLSEKDVYWLPVILDGTPTTPIFMRGSTTPNLPEEVNDQLEKAARQFELALSKYPGYLEGTLNLATTYFYLSKYHKVSALLKEAKLLYPSNQKIDELINLALYQELKEKIDVSSHVLEELEKGTALNKDNTPSHQFNLARMLDETGNTERAHDYWVRLSDQVETLIEPFKTIVLNKRNLNNVMQTPTALDYNDFVSQPKPITDTKRHYLSKIGDDDLYRLNHDNYFREYKTKTRLLFTRYRLPTEDLKKKLTQCCDRPNRIFPTTNGEIWSISNDLAVLITNTEESEIWFK